MRKVLLLCLLVGVMLPGSVLAAGPGSWPMAGHDAQGTSFNATERILGARNIASLHQVWHLSLRPTGVAVATGTRLFALALHGSSINVLTLEARSGKLLRTLTLNNLQFSSGELSTALAYSRGKLIVGGYRNSTTAVDAASGRVLWRAPVPAQFLTVDGNTAYTGKGCQNSPSTCGLGTSSAIDTRTGHILWQHPGNGGQLPALIAGHLYQVWGKSTRVYNPVSGSLLGTLPFAAAWTGNARNAYALDFATGSKGRAWVAQIGPNGKPKWKNDLGIILPIAAAPVFSPGTLYVSSHRFRAGVIAINAANGRILWGADTGPPRQIIAANGLLYVLINTDSSIHVLSASTGKELRRIAPPAGGTVLQELIANGTLYEITIGGIVAMRP